MLPAAAGAGDLLRGLAMLTRVRAAMGDRAARNATIRIPEGTPAPRQDVTHPKWARANATLARLRAQTPREVSGIGAVQAIQLYLPPTEKPKQP